MGAGCSEGTCLATCTRRTDCTNERGQGQEGADHSTGGRVEKWGDGPACYRGQLAGNQFAVCKGGARETWRGVWEIIVVAQAVDMVYDGEMAWRWIKRHVAGRGCRPGLA